MLSTELFTDDGATFLPWWRRKKAEEVQRRSPLQHELALDTRLDVVETELAALKKQFRQLRGYVYVRKGLVGNGAPPGDDVELPPERSAPAPSAAPGLTKDELRRKLIAEGRLGPSRRE